MYQNVLLVKGILIILGVPLLVVLLSEIIEQCQQRGNPLARFFSALRNLVLPSLVFYIVLKYFLYVTSDRLLARVFGTLFWLTILYATLLLLSAFLIRNKKERTWQINISNILLQFIRTTVVIGLLGYILSKMWSLDLTKILGALGVGSLVMALALQDTLSNLVSGFLLIIESPFKVGDWIKVGDLTGQVIEINWRAVRLKTTDCDAVIIPNGFLGKANIFNYNLLNPLYLLRLKFPFSYEEHPDLVEKTLLEVAHSIEEIERNPGPEVAPKLFKNTHIEYEIRFFIKDYEIYENIQDIFSSRLYYAIHRNSFHIPFPDKIEYKIDRLPKRTNSSHDQISKILCSQSIFSRLDKATLIYLTNNTTIELFGMGENIVEIGLFDKAFFIILAGKATLFTNDCYGQQKELTELSEGDFLGEMVFFPDSPSAVSATVQKTVSAITITPEAISYLSQNQPRFAIEISQFIDERRKLILSAENQISS